MLTPKLMILFFLHYQPAILKDNAYGCTDMFHNPPNPSIPLSINRTAARPLRKSFPELG